MVGETAPFASTQGEFYNDRKSTIKGYLNVADASYPNNVPYDTWDMTKYELGRYSSKYYRASNTYFYVRSKADFGNDTVTHSGGTAVKYWISIGDHRYLLFETKEDLQSFYQIS